MTNEEIEIRKRLITDFPLYSENILKIAHKNGSMAPFVMNSAQRYVHDIVEKQLKEKGYVRVIILKGRQQGCSTYVAGRFYWKVSQNFGKRARVIAHTAETADMLFEMTKTYHDNCPDELRPHASSESMKKYVFDGISSGYRVSTAGAGQAGRGGTLQYLHWSEVGFSEKADDLFAGVVQSVPSGAFMENTEIFLESTSAGPQGKFYEVWEEAEAGKGLYIPIFIPWWWQEEYVVPITDDIKFDEEELVYKNDTGVTDENLLWRRYQISEIGEAKFKREYPRSPEEAFEEVQMNNFFKRDKVKKCAEPKDMARINVGARVGALDPAGDGINSDRSAIGWGDDIAIREVEYWTKLDEYQLAKRAEDYIDRHNLEVFWVDAIGLGSGVYANMKNGRFKNIVRPYKGSNSSSTFVDGKEVYENRRAESYGRLREWIGEGDMYQIPNDKELIRDICGPLELLNEKSGKIQVESKKDMKSRGLSSPDGLDVCAMIKCEKINLSLTNRDGYDTVTTKYNVLDYGL